MAGTNFFTAKNSKVAVALTDEVGNAILIKCTVANLPTNDGYAKGCIAITENGALYVNTGTTTVASFMPISNVTAGSITLATLASGIAPSHVVKYAGKVTWSGGTDTLATTVTGVASTDIVIATIQTAPTEDAYLVSATPSTNVITFKLSAANTSNDAVIAYAVLRAAA